MPDSLRPHRLQPTRLFCPWDFSRQGYWSGLPFPSPGDLPNPGIEPRSPALQADSLPTELQGKHISSVQSLSRVWLFATPWIAARQASLSITNSRSSLRLTSIESVMPSSHLSLCRPLLLLPPIPPSIRVFSNESTLRTRWPKYWSFSLSISPSNEHPGLIIHYKYMIYAHTALLGTHEKTGIGKINWHSRILNSSIWLQKSSCRKM